MATATPVATATDTATTAGDDAGLQQLDLTAGSFAGVSVDGLIDQIRSAYERVPRPSNRELLHPQCADDNDIVWLHDVADWQSLVEADTEPDYASLAFLSPEGFRHFLPAYLIWALRHLDSDSVVLDSLVFHFRPGPENLEKFRKSKYSTFDADQLAAAEVALALIRMVVDSES